MQALILNAYKSLAVDTIPDPIPGPRDVLIAVRACGICGSDVHGMDGSTGRRKPPIVMGHEAAGVVVARGTEVTQWKMGDRVTFDSTVSCGTCNYCLEGRINLCNDRRVLGVSCDDYRQNGAFAEYVAVPEHIVYRVPERLSLEHAAMVEPVSVAVHAVRRARVKRGMTAVVFGSGMIGQLIVQVLKSRCAGCVIAVDVDDSRLALAATLGADMTLNPNRTDIASAVRDSTGGIGAHIAFEAVGTGKSLNASIACVRKGGCVVLVGNVAPEVSFPLQTVVTREIDVLGSCASAGEYPECLDLMASGSVKVQPLITAVAPLTEGPVWFDRLYRREPGLMKVVLTPEHA